MRKLAYLFILLIIASYPVLSQNSTTATSTYRPGHIAPWPDYSNYYEGTRYLNEDFINGEVYFNGKAKSIKAPVRLNLHSDQFEYMKNDSVLAIGNQKIIDKIVVGEDIFIYIDPDLSANVAGYVKNWNAEAPAVITKMKTEFHDKIAGVGYSESKSARFERDEDRHYIMNADGKIERIKSVKKLIKYLGSHQEELSKFAKEEKISANDPKKLAKLLDYFQDLEHQSPV